MRIANTQVLNQNQPIEDQITILQLQINKLYACLEGRVSFGTGVTGTQSGNLEGEWRTYTSNATPNTEDTLPHTIGSVPLGYLVVNQNKSGNIYGTPTLGTAWTASSIFLKCDVASVTFLLYLVKKGQVTS
jgi:hypothetical protein